MASGASQLSRHRRNRRHDVADRLACEDLVRERRGHLLFRVSQGAQGIPLRQLRNEERSLRSDPFPHTSGKPLPRCRIGVTRSTGPVGLITRDKPRVHRARHLTARAVRVQELSQIALAVRDALRSRLRGAFETSSPFGENAAERRRCVSERLDDIGDIHRFPDSSFEERQRRFVRFGETLLLSKRGIGPASSVGGSRLCSNERHPTAGYLSPMAGDRGQGPNGKGREDEYANDWRCCGPCHRRREYWTFSGRRQPLPLAVFPALAPSIPLGAPLLTR
jgi:hypothetical protein